MSTASTERLRIIALAGARAAQSLADRLAVPLCRLESRRFADGESYLRVLDDVGGCDVAVVAELRDPDAQLAPLLFMADALREMGAAHVALVAPYLPYMRQDTRFQPGEAITSRSFAKLVSKAYDGLVTVDPHLHRYTTLEAIYSIPSRIVSSAPAIADWVRTQVARPLIIGPDAESEQWISQVAALAHCPHRVLAKRRCGDHDVEVALPDLQGLHDRTPVLVDDIIATAGTMATAVQGLRGASFVAPVCAGVHAVFVDGALARLEAAGAARVVTCNTLPHPTNGIDLGAALAEAVQTSVYRPRSG
jgi:ribose-phosphate pyrophosphokinase